MPIPDASQALLRLLQLASPALPVGSFSYSEGLETLTAQGQLQSPQALTDWLTQELRYGAIRMEGAVMVRAYQATQQADWATVARWNQWWSAARETEELRSQSWQMGRALLRMVEQMQPELRDAIAACQPPCHFAIAFGLTAATWEIPLTATLLGYLQSWATNLINSGVKLIPLGQTAGQQSLMALYPLIEATATAIINLPDEQLESSGWGLSLASMQHETLYTRLFRS